MMNFAEERQRVAQLNEEAARARAQQRRDDEEYGDEDMMGDMGEDMGDPREQEEMDEFDG